MGATNFFESAEGKTAQEAFDLLQEEAVYWYGRDPYNGTISTCALANKKPKVVQKTYGPRAVRKAYEIAEADGFGKKWEAKALDLGSVKGKRGIHMWAFYGWAAC